MLCRESDAPKYAKLLISCYPNSAITEPEYYITLLVTVFVQYDLPLVQKACGPRGIPADIPKFLPTIGEVGNWLQGKADDHYRQKEQSKFKYIAPRYLPPAPAEPNLFVPEGVPNYDDAVDFSQIVPERFYKFEKDHVCYDGEIKDGYWVPGAWWEVRHTLSPMQWVESLKKMGGLAGMPREEIKVKALTEDQKKAALESAARTGSEFVGLQLKPETLETICEKQGSEPE